MKRNRILASALALCMLLSLSSTALAAGEVTTTSAVELPSDILVFSNADMIVFDDVQPQYTKAGDQPQLMLPLRKVMDSFGAKVDYIPATRSVSVEYDGTVVSFPIGAASAAVTDKASGAKKTVPISPAPMYVSGRTLVPMSFLSDNFGLLVSASEGGVSVMDLKDLLKGIDERSLILNKMLSLQNAHKSVTVSGSVEGSVAGKLPLTAGDALTEFAVPFSATVSSSASGMDAKGDAKLNLDLKDLTKLLPAGDEQTSAMITALLPALSSLSFEYLLDSKKGVVYVHCPLVNTMMGYAQADWIGLNLAELGVDFSAYSATDLTYGALIETIIRAQAQTMPMDYQMVSSMVSSIDAVCSDKAFVKSGTDAAPVYTMTMTKDSLVDLVLETAKNFPEEEITREQVLAELTGIEFGMKLQVAFKAGNTFSSSVDMTMKMNMDGIGMNMVIKGTDEFPGRSVIDMDISMDMGAQGAFGLKLKYDFVSKLGDAPIKLDPPPGTKMLDISSLIK